MNKLNNKDGKLHIGEKEVIAGWESFSGWYWFATELEQEDYGGHKLWFGFVQGMYEEWGSFWEGELQPLIDSGKVWKIKDADLPQAGRRD